MAESDSYNYGYDQPGDATKYTALREQPPAPPYSPPQVMPLHTQPVSQQPMVNNTTIIMQQPQVASPGPRKWSSEVCGCFDDMGICCFGFFCGCCLASNVAVDMNESSCVICCVPGALIALRMKMRLQQNITGSLMDDCCTVTFCGSCALCQLAREVKYCQQHQQQQGHCVI